MITFGWTWRICRKHGRPFLVCRHPKKTETVMFRLYSWTDLQREIVGIEFDRRWEN